MIRETILATTLAISLAACTTTPTGKSAVSAPKAGAYLTQAAAIINLAAALDAASPTPHPAVETVLHTASTALSATAADLTASGATSGDVGANMKLAYTTIESLIAGTKAVDPKTAAKAQAYLDTLTSMIGLYNAEAPVAGLPLVPLPA